MFHALDPSVTSQPTNAASKPQNRSGLIRALVIFAAAASILFVLWILQVSQTDPYIKATLSLNGSSEKGEQLFRMNCVGCHGINAQGLVGPNLNDITYRLSDKQIIKQVVNGLTPPMPSFEMEPQAMADLLAHLNSLS